MRWISVPYSGVSVNSGWGYIHSECFLWKVMRNVVMNGLIGMDMVQR